MPETVVRVFPDNSDPVLVTQQRTSRDEKKKDEARRNEICDTRRKIEEKLGKSKLQTRVKRYTFFSKNIFSKKLKVKFKLRWYFFAKTYLEF